MKDRYLLGLSGGKDSAALALYMKRVHPELDIEYFFTDTGKELPEVYEFLVELEGRLGKKISRLQEDRFVKRTADEESEGETPFDWWLQQNTFFLPSPQQRWCTINLKLKPFRKWVNQMLEEGYRVTQFVAIRADEDHREGLQIGDPRLITKLPFREDGIDKRGVLDELERNGVDLPKYYEWRSRSGCSFCFFQQKIEWVNLMDRHPEKFEEAKRYEKLAIDHASPFTWTEGESLEELARPERVAQIKADYQARKERALACKSINPLHEGFDDIDEIYDEEEGGGACLICHK